MKKKTTQRGFVGTIILIVIGLFLLSIYTSFDVGTIVSKGFDSKYGQKVKDIIKSFWSDHLASYWNGFVKPSLTYFWDTIAQLIIESIQTNIQAVVNNVPTPIEERISDIFNTESANSEQTATTTPFTTPTDSLLIQ